MSVVIFLLFILNLLMLAFSLASLIAAVMKKRSLSVFTLATVSSVLFAATVMVLLLQQFLGE